MARELMYVDAAVGVGSVNGGQSITVSITPAFPDSINRAHLISVTCYDSAGADNGIFSLTVGGVAATLVKRQAGAPGAVDAYLYVARNPPKGTHNVVVTFNVLSAIGRMHIIEVEQLDPVDGVGLTDGTATTGTTDTRTLSDAEANSGMCLHVTGALGGTSNITVADPTYGTSDTVQVGASPNRVRTSTSLALNASSPVTLRHNVSLSKPFAHAAASIRGETYFPQCASMGMGF